MSNFFIVKSSGGGPSSWNIAQTQNVFRGTAATSQTITLASNATTGNALILVIKPGNLGPINSLSMSPGSASFSRIATKNDGIRVIEIWAASNITGGITPTITVNLGSSTVCEITVYEGSGGDPTGATDGTNSATGSGTAMTTGSITTTRGTDLIVKGIYVGSSPNGVAQAGWTEYNPSANANVYGETVQGTAGSITGTATQTSSGSYIGVIAAFK